MKIAVDAMGGDYAPEAIVEGAVQAAKEYGFPLILIGQEDRVQKELVKYKTDHLEIEVKHAPQIIDMHDLPSFALRRKKESSLHIAINMIRHGEADAVVSAGNTGAAMTIGKVACRMLEGVERPALATVMPNINGFTIVIDVGANVDCKPNHLLQFAVMGHLYAKEVHRIESPRIGLLSIGEEESKGNTLTREVFEPLSNTKLNFIGNAEGRDVFNGRVDVVVCDGFIGNVVLKVSESLAKTMGTILREGFTKNWRTKLGYLLVKPEMEAMKRRVDYSEYGGAPLLGLNGVVIVSHGRSNAKAIKNAIRVAAESVDHHLNDQIVTMTLECGFDTKSRSRATSLWRQLTGSIRHDSDKEKSNPDTQEKPEQNGQFQTPEPSSEKDLKQEEQEQGKKPWWRLKHREGEKEESSPEKVQEAAQIEQEPEIVQVEERVPSQEQEKAEEPKSEKKPWWHLRDSKQQESDQEEIAAEEKQEDAEQHDQEEKSAQLEERAPPQEKEK